MSVPVHLHVRRENVTGFTFQFDHPTLGCTIETGVYRYKQTFGAEVSSRKEENQNQEMRLNCKILNLMTHLGMPNSECIIN
jgi:hypothetical protein